MPMISQSPAYNLKAVLIETGLKADVLRAWERRYDLPQPQRTPGGHRLYSEYDIETVKWLRMRQAEGLSISRAVELWKENIQAGLDPLAGFSTAGSAPVSDRFPLADTRIEILRQNWLKANLAFDSFQVDEILNQAFAIYPVETVCTEILQQGVCDIGNYWYLDKASVQQEHFASALANRRLETLIAATPRPTRHQTILIGCPPGERHTFSALLLNLFLCRRGWKVVYLGADVPFERLEETIAAIQADLIVLAAQQLTTAATLQSTALTLQGQGIPLAYGGLVFNRVPGIRERIPAYFLGESLEEAMYLIERLVIAPAAYPTAISMVETHRALANLYREKRFLIERALFEELQKVDLPREHISEANLFFGNGLSAALELGNPAFLETDLEWIKSLLSGRHIYIESLSSYLAAYSYAVRKEMGNIGAPIIDWIGSYLAQNEAVRM
jgi:MerR family transcriptional regulator, light-induced transcriptional regulator